MVLLRTLPSPAQTTTCCIEYARKASVEELDFCLAMLSNYGSTISRERRRQSTISSGTTSDLIDPLGSVITPPSTPDIIRTPGVHRWGASSASSNSTRSSLSGTSPSSHAYLSARSSCSSGLGPSDFLIKLPVKRSITAPSPVPELEQIMRSASSTSATGPNVVAIDNKIEQAMDLVKTHLTFAVREEVEILRSTIVELETKVAQLESQNQVLKQFAPIEVVNSLAALVQQNQQKPIQMQQQQLASSGATPISTQQTSVQNAPVSAVQNIQQQSMSTLANESSAASVSNTPIVSSPTSAGLLTISHVADEQQKQPTLSSTSEFSKQH